MGTGDGEPGPWLAWWLLSLGSRAGNGPRPRAGSEERSRPWISPCALILTMEPSFPILKPMEQ